MEINYNELVKGHNTNKALKLVSRNEEIAT
jgi:hypothetical protein